MADGQFHDLMFQWRGSLAPPEYDPIVAHVDIGSQTLERLGSPFPSHADYAAGVEALSSMGVAAIAFDMIFATAPKSSDEGVFAAAASGAGSVYLGMALRPVGEEEAGIPIAEPALESLAELSRVARGVGHLNVDPDADGVYRRLPLVYSREGGGYHLSLALQVVAGVLRASSVQVVPGREIVLSGARRPTLPEPVTLSIPVDREGCMVVNFVGPWGSMDHYEFSDAMLAEAQGELDLWEEELGGRVLVVADVATGSTDVGPVPTDRYYPMSGVHANAMHTILTGKFLRELGTLERIGTDLFYVVLLAVLAMCLTPAQFALGSIAVLASYVTAGQACFIWFGVVPHFGSIGLLAGVCFVAVPAYRYVYVLELQVRERTRQLQETHAELEETQSCLIAELQKELQTAHDLQQSLMPQKAPAVPGVELAGLCVPATDVGGDFYQYFQDDGRVCVALADVTGHAMEAAIPVVLFSGILDNQMERYMPLPELFRSLNRSMCRSLGSHTYVCLSMLELDPAGHAMRVCNCGCPYPLHYRAAVGQVVEVEVQAYPLGVRPATEYAAIDVQLEDGDYVVLHSDGFSEATNADNQPFGFHRTIELIRRGCSERLDPESLIGLLVAEVRSFTGDGPQADDMTCVVVRVERQRPWEHG